MDLSYSEEQNILAESAGRYMEDAMQFEQRQQLLQADVATQKQAMAPLLDMGLATILLPESDGGIAGNGFDIMVVADAFGKALMPLPILPLIALSVPLACSDKDIIASILSGRLIMPALHERELRYDLENFSTHFVDGTVTGTKTLVPGAALADGFLVATDAGIAFVDGIDGCQIESYNLQDGSPAADVTFEKCSARLIETPNFETAIAQYIAAMCAFTTGAMGTVVDMTREYLSVRKQFGKPLAAFQELNFRLVDLNTATEEAQAMSIYAAHGVSSGDAALAQTATSAAKAKIGLLSSYVGEDSVQMHGGMGVTEEYPIGWYMKHFAVFNYTFGDSDYHYESYAKSL